MEQRCSEGGTASVEKARESKPRNSDHVVKTTGMLAANDLEQRFSEGGISDSKKGGTASKMEEPIGGWAQPRGGPVSLQGIGRGLAWAGGK
jgi:hypothetical protein